MNLAKALITLALSNTICMHVAHAKKDDAYEVFFRIRGGVAHYTGPAVISTGSIKAMGYCTDGAVGFEAKLNKVFYFQSLVNINTSYTSNHESSSGYYIADEDVLHVTSTVCLDLNVGKKISLGPKVGAIDIAAGVWAGWIVSATITEDGTNNSSASGKEEHIHSTRDVVRDKNLQIGLAAQLGYSFLIFHKKTVLSIATRIPLENAFQIASYTTPNETVTNKTMQYTLGLAVYPFGRSRKQKA